MAIPFYEPRHQHTTECDQVDGHFPPAPSSQSVALPTANLAIPVAIIQPAASTSTNATRAIAGIATATAISSESTAVSAISLATSTSSSTVTASTAVTNPTEAIASNVGTASNIVTPSHSVSPPAAATAIFSISANNPAISPFLPTNVTSTESIQTTCSPPVTLASEPLPWKLLAVAMCKALKQYHQQTGSRDFLTKTVIEIVPSGGGGAQGQPSAAGN